MIDGLSGEQRFFMGWAQMWRAREREAYIRSTLEVSPYLPGSIRANAIVRNNTAFIDAFGVKEGDRMYLVPADRVSIW